MNAKARKKEKRRLERLARSESTTTAAEDAALDAVTQSVQEPTPSLEGTTPTSASLREAVLELMPETFAAVLAQRLEDKGHVPATEDELHTLAKIMEQELLPTTEWGVLEMRRR